MSSSCGVTMSRSWVERRPPLIRSSCGVGRAVWGAIWLRISSGISVWSGCRWQPRCSEEQAPYFPWFSRLATFPKHFFQFATFRKYFFQKVSSIPEKSAIQTQTSWRWSSDLNDGIHCRFWPASSRCGSFAPSWPSSAIGHSSTHHCPTCWLLLLPSTTCCVVNCASRFLGKQFWMALAHCQQKSRGLRALRFF